MTGSINRPSKKTDYLANARAAWGDAMPDWVAALAAEGNRTSGAAVGARLDYSPAVISDVIRCKYKGAIAAVEQKVRGALMGETLTCPIVGEMRRDACAREQKKDFVGTSEIRTALYRACRSGCVHSRLTKTEETADA
jgi:hypothetical protein